MSKVEDAAFETWKQEMVKALGEKGNTKAAEAFTALIEADPDVGREIVRGTMRHSDYTKKTMELAEARKAVELEQISLKKKEEGWLGWYGDAQKKYSEMEKQLAEMRAGSHRDDEGGDPLETPMNTKLPTNVATKEELEELKAQLARVDNGAVNFSIAMTSVMNRAIDEGMKIDPKKILDRALRDNIDPETAYERETASTRAERAQKEQEKREREAYEKGKREALSTKATPDSLGITSPASPLEAALSGKVHTNAADRQRAALAAFLEGQS